MKSRINYPHYYDEKITSDTVTHKIDFTAKDLRRDHPPAWELMMTTFSDREVSDIKIICSVKKLVNILTGVFLKKRSVPLSPSVAGPGTLKKNITK